VRKVFTGVGIAAALLASALIAPTAQASTCDGTGAEQAFLAWNDSASYILVDGGDFESAAAGWTLAGGAATATGGNPLRPQSSANALSLPSGASATTPAICVSKGDPYARAFVQSVDPAAKSTISVEVLYLNADGDVRKIKKAGKLRTGASWRPTRRFSLAQGQFVSGKANDGEHGQSGADHGQSGEDHGQSGEDHGESGDDHGQSGDDHGQSGDDHGQSGDDHGQSGDDPGQAGEPGQGADAAVKSASIALRFTAKDGAALIDDVLVDPRMRL
jgi:hypothetical protein